jgi:tetratricopeptide (TPR) repeat protein
MRYVCASLVLILVAAAFLVFGRRHQTDYASACRQAFEGARWQELAELSQAWSTAEPARAEAWMYRAEAAQRNGNLAAAVEALKRVPLTDPEAERAYGGLIELQFGPLNRPQDAAESCLALLEHHPESKLAHQRLIFYYAFTLQRQKLIQQVRRAVELRCEPKEAYTYLFLVDSLRLGNAAPQNGRWLESDPHSELFSVAQALHIAETLEGQVPRDDPKYVAEVQQARARRDRTLSELRVRFPENLELIAWFARRAVQDGDTQRLRELLTGAPDAAEHDHRFWRFRGWLLDQHNELDDAEAAYRQALTLHPLDGGTRPLLAALLRRKGKTSEAETMDRLAQQALRLNRLLGSQPTARAVPVSVLTDLADYAAKCGDELIADTLTAQLRKFGRSGGERP